jgi:hypothetical protein
MNWVRAEVVTFSGGFGFTWYDFESLTVEHFQHALEKVEIDLGSNDIGIWESRAAEQGLFSGVRIVVRKDPDTQKYFITLTCTSPSRSSLADFYAKDRGELMTVVDWIGGLGPIGLRCGRTDFVANTHKYGLEASFGILQDESLLK